MESEEFRIIIKDEIEVEEERIIKIENENTEIVHNILTLPECDINKSILPVTIDSFHNIEINIKQEHNGINYLINGESFSNKPNDAHSVTKTLKDSADIDIKEEKNDTIVSYDYPNFDDCGSIDSNDIEALGNVEACLQDDSDIKTENETWEDSQKEEFRNTEAEGETEITPDQNSSTHITPDPSDYGPKYSFVMKIPSDVMMNIDQIVTADLNNESIDEEDVKCNSSLNPDEDIRTGAESFTNATEQNSLLEESDKSETFNLNPFQLNSITGNILSLEQEAYNMLRPPNHQCPKCSKTFTRKNSLSIHLKVHQTIDNYTNGWKRGLETKRKNKLKKKVSSKTPIKQEPESQDPPPVSDRKELYKCTCGKTFQRKTRMEACLRSHDCCESEKFYCMTCLKEFGNKDELALHRKRLHRKKFPCKFCPTDYATRKKLFKHLQLHQKVHQTEYKAIEEVIKGKKKLRCFLCSRFCAGISELKIHVLSEHKGPYLCPHCKNSFPKIIDFNNHTKTYHPKVESQLILEVLEAFSRLIQEWKCEECDLQFFEADKLALHQVEQHSPELKTEQQFQCPDCRRVFISQKGLTSHRRIHHSIESSEQAKEEITGIMCLECRKMCKDITALTSHMRFHSMDRKYPCKFCDFRFATPEKRKVHAEVHTGEMKFVCFICEYQCSSENRLKKHKQSLKHANMKEYLLTGKPLIEEPSTEDKKEVSPKKKLKCKVNDSASDTKSISEVSCDVCGENFSSESEMLEHKQTHPFIEFPNDDKPSRIFFK